MFSKYQISNTQRIEEEISRNNKEIKETQAALALELNFEAIRREQNDVLNAYTFNRDNSWRGWKLLRDKTVDAHVKKMQRRIKELDINSLIGYMQGLNEEVAYASQKSGEHYCDAIKEMKSAFINSFDNAAYNLLVNIAHKKDEVERLISKQHGHEEYHSTCRDCVHSFKRMEKKNLVEEKSKSTISYLFQQPKEESANLVRKSEIEARIFNL